MYIHKYININIKMDYLETNVVVNVIGVIICYQQIIKLTKISSINLQGNFWKPKSLVETNIFILIKVSNKIKMFTFFVYYLRKVQFLHVARWRHKYISFFHR